MNQEVPAASALSVADAGKLIARLRENVSKVLLGKPEPIRLALVALFADGHVLIEDTPGVGKTSLAKAIAKSLACQFTRLQFTPDMLPSDILGSSVFLPNMGDFEFRKGPVFTNVLLADEINRTTPRTQSALLEAMEERQVSAEGTTRPLDPPFFVIATQNPHEFEGTYPLPENQLDRFLLCTGIGYPDRQFEKAALQAHRDGQPVEHIEAVLSKEEVRNLQSTTRRVKVEDSLEDYLLEIISATRGQEQLEVGVSTRGALTFYRACQAHALIEGRDYVVPDDIKSLAVPVLAHRIVTRGVVREGHRNRAKLVIQEIMDSTKVPA